MSERLSGATTIGDLEGRGVQRLDDLVGEPSIGTYTSDDETVEYVVVGSDGGLVRETDDWQTKEVPGPDAGVVVLVTDRRVTFVVGECRDPDVDGNYVQRVDHGSVDDVEFKNSLLSTWFAVHTEDGVRLEITPTVTDGLGDVREYIDRASIQWTNARKVFDGFGSELVALEDEVANGEEDRADEHRGEIRESLSQLGQSSSIHAVDLPAIGTERDEAQERVTNAFRRGYWHRARELTVDGDDRRENGAVLESVRTYRDACQACASLAKKGGPGEQAFGADALDADLGPFDLVDALVDRLADCRRLLEGEDPLTQLRGWPALLRSADHLRTAVHVAGDEFDCDPDAVTDRIDDWCRGISAPYGEAVATVEERGDAAYDENDDDTARERYEEALDAIEEQRRLADVHEAFTTADSIDGAHERLEEKMERFQWEWVGDQ